jgi:hypothetical protein
MGRKFGIAVLALAVLIGSDAFGLSWLKKDNVIFKKGRDTWVKLDKGNKKLAPFDHPREFTAREMQAVFASVRFFKPGVFSFGGKQGKEFDLFTAEEAAILAEHLTEAFARAGPDQWVDFSLNVFRGQTFIGNYRLSDGVMFVKDGKLNLAFRNISLKINPDDQPNAFDPTKGYRAFNKLVAGEGQELVDENWLEMDVKNLPMTTAIKPAPAPAATGVPAPSETTAPAPAAAQPEATPAKASVKERLLELQELYDEGLITQEEYQQKRKEILEDL